MAELNGLTWQRFILPVPVNPLYALACESVLFETLPPSAGRLMLWRSLPSIVVGKNQNPWRECGTDQIVAEGGSWVRRQTGGGAVYHDPGNLCYSIMMPRTGYCPDWVGGRIAAALAPLGIRLQVGPRHVLEIDGRKVSGTAFCHRRDRVLHHGTLLVAADLERLHRWLTPALPKMETRAVASVPSPVINLQTLLPTLAITALVDALAITFGPAPEIMLDRAAVEAEMARFSHTDWRYGLTPQFTVATAQGQLTIRAGRITDAPGALEHLRGQLFEPALIPT